MVSASKLTGRGVGGLTVQGRWACVIHYGYLISYGAVGRHLQVSPDTVKKWAVREILLTTSRVQCSH